MFNKKGVSEVVANVLIVLLVIVGVAVIWSVVKPTIDKSAKEINTECFNVKVSPVSCTTAGASVVKRDAGAGGFQGFKVVFEDASGATEVFTHLDATVSELATKSYADTLTITPVRMNVAAIVGPNSADVRTCDVLTAPISCT